MFSEAAVLIALSAVAWIFAAGGLWVRVSRLAKDLNGLGRKVNVMEKDDRYARICVALMAIAPQEKQQLVVDCLGGKPQ